MKVSFINNLKARRNRRAVLLLKECSRDAAFNHQLISCSSQKPFFPVCKVFFGIINF